MDALSATVLRLAPASPSWGAGARARRPGERHPRRGPAATIDVAAAPAGPSIGLLAQALAQRFHDQPDPRLAARYGAAGAVRYACGVCVDVRA